VVASRLRQRVQHTILRDPEEQIKLLKLSEEAAAICEAIGARRFQYVDQPYPGKQTKRIIEFEVCPFGCLKHERRWIEIHPAAAAMRVARKGPLLAAHLDRQIVGRGGALRGDRKSSGSSPACARRHGTIQEWTVVREGCTQPQLVAFSF
jgi:hypothetical protein